MEGPQRDEDVARYVGELGLPGLVDIHVHFAPPSVQRAIWGYFDRLEGPSWPITYRVPAQQRLETLSALGVRLHTALAYAHKPDMAAFLNRYTLDLAAREPAVVPTFTFYPEDTVEAYVGEALDAGGQVAKVHLQVGRFHATDPRLDQVWREVARRRIVVVLHAAAVYGVDGGEEYCGADEVAALLDRHPDLVIVIAHLGAPDFGDFLVLAERTPGLYLDTAMVLTDPPYIGRFPDALHERLLRLHPRILFGSDFPTIPHDYAAQVRGVLTAGWGPEALRGILHDNAVALLERVGSGL